MGIRKYKPTTPGRRGSSVADFAEITRDHPEKSLVRPLHSKGGRNAHGRVTTRHQGGGHKRASVPRRTPMRTRTWEAMVVSALGSTSIRDAVTTMSSVARW